MFFSFILVRAVEWARAAGADHDHQPVFATIDSVPLASEKRPPLIRRAFRMPDRAGAGFLPLAGGGRSGRRGELSVHGATIEVPSLCAITCRAFGCSMGKRLKSAEGLLGLYKPRALPAS